MIAAEVVTNLCDNESEVIKEGSGLAFWKGVDSCLFLDDAP